MNLPALDIALRAASAAWLLLTAALLWRDHGRQAAGRLGALFALGAAADALLGAAGPGEGARAWQAPLIALRSGNPVVFWLFSRTLFDDGFRRRRWHLVLWLLLALAGLLACFSARDAAAALWLPRLLQASPLLFAALAVAQTFATWRDDLVERRRRLRAPLVAVVASYMVLVAAVKLGLPLRANPEAASVLEATALALLVAVVMSRLLKLRGADLFGAPIAAPDAGATGAAPVDATPPALEPADQPLVTELQRRMASDRLYREENLTIGALAQRMGLPEHRLRRLINQGLGHRNFNAFLNGYRLAEAKQALADPARGSVPVLEIAMDAGFQSLGPFNRAFKADTGMTPTEFRRQQQAGTKLADSGIG
jgi:AraC-like DNA-binding protein